MCKPTQTDNTNTTVTSNVSMTYMKQKATSNKNGSTFSLFRSFITIIYCHAFVTYLCFSVAFDLLFFGMIFYSMKATSVITTRTFYKMTTRLINWTTPIVIGIPMVLSGTRVFCDDIELLLESKEKNSLLLANHGSRIDWMVAMFVGYATRISGIPSKRSRVNFVCEALIQYMPFIGWYRKLVCQDIFVRRTFSKDKSVIQQNILEYNHCAADQQRRMLFLSPEGVVVDFNEQSVNYIQNCKNFCLLHGYKPFEYVLTPRFKGITCLVDQIQGDGKMVSVCVAYMRNGQLLNCHLMSPHRLVVDIYLLNQGLFNEPVDIFIDLQELRVTTNGTDMKKILLDDYQRKDQLLATWDRANKSLECNLKLPTTQIRQNGWMLILHHLLHFSVMATVLISFDCLYSSLNLLWNLFLLICTLHTIGWWLNSSSMESVPFETGVKGIIELVLKFQKKRKKNDESTRQEKNN